MPSDGDRAPATIRSDRTPRERWHERCLVRYRLSRRWGRDKREENEADQALAIHRPPPSLSELQANLGCFAMAYKLPAGSRSHQRRRLDAAREGMILGR